MRRIQAKKHKLGTYEVNKISLSCFDDKTICYEKEEILTDKKDSKNFHKKKRFSRKKGLKKSSHEKKIHSQILTNRNKCVQINSR